MEQISYSLPIKRFGKVLVIVLDKKFEEGFKVKDGDVAIPSSIKYTPNEREKLTQDPVLNDKHLCLVIQRRNINSVLDMITVMGDDK